MDIKKRLEKEIEKQEQTIHELNMQLVGAHAYLRAQQDMLKMLPRQPGDDSPSGLRPSGDPAKIREILKKTGVPMHINDILAKLGKEATPESRATIASTLGSYVRKGQVFTRTAPNTFGLSEFDEKVAKYADPEVPEGFGSEGGDNP